MKTAFFAWLSNNFKNTIIDYEYFYKSFKHFHPDIDLIIFEDKDIAEVFNAEDWITPTSCKAAFAKKLYNEYDLVVNVDADFYFFDRCHEILEADYDVAACANFNNSVNTALKGNRVLRGYDIPDVDYVHYVQGGLVASTKKEFWDEYYNVTRDLWKDLPLYENDTLNIVWFSGKYKTKVLDGDYDFRSTNFKQYYNCASLGREGQCVIRDNKVFLDNKPMRSYHVAFGNHGPQGPRKKRMHEIFSPQVSNWFYSEI